MFSCFIFWCRNRTHFVSASFSHSRSLMLISFTSSLFIHVSALNRKSPLDIINLQKKKKRKYVSMQTLSFYTTFYTAQHTLILTFFMCLFCSFRVSFRKKCALLSREILFSRGYIFRIFFKATKSRLSQIPSLLQLWRDESRIHFEKTVVHKNSTFR